MRPVTTGGGPAVPASFAQRGIWLVEQLDPDSTAYHIPWVVHLDGALDAAALRRALNTVVSRHESLRTVFAVAGGEPVQVVTDPVELELPGHPPDRDVVGQLVGRPFDLARGPLLRAALVRLAPQRHQLVLVVHHIIADGWSGGVLMDELSSCYRDLTAGREPVPAGPAIQYPDYSQWQHRRWREGELAEHLAYWRAELAGAPTVFPLPADHPRPAVQSDRGEWLPVPVLADLRALARTARATRFHVLLAAFAGLLFRYTGAPDFLIGVPVSGRTRPETAGLIGYLANLLPLRCRPTAALTFRGLVDQVRTAAVDALAHQDVPYERLVELLAPERSPAYSPLVQVVFAFSPRPAPLTVAGLRWRLELATTGTVKADLQLAVEDAAVEPVVRLGHRTDLLDRGTAEAMAAALGTLLRGASADPDRPIGTVPLLTGAHRRRAGTAGTAGTPAPEPVDVTAAVQRWARERGGAAAVAGGDGQLTYRELADRANLLAHLLRSDGVGPDTAVGVCLEPSAALVVAELAVWQAGGVMLALDPRLPPERLRLLLADANAAVLVAGRPARDLLGDDPGIATVRFRLDHEPAGRAGPARPLPPLAAPGHLACLRYPPGSTGRPRAVAVPRHAVCHLLGQLLALPVADRWLGVAAPAGGVPPVEHMLPLLAGATLALAAPGQPVDALRRRLVKERITALQADATTWEALADAGVPAQVRLRLVAGELPRAGLAAALLADGAQAWALQGPAEAAGYAAVTGTPVRFSHAVSGTRRCLLDAGGQPVPVGAVGELCLGGAGLARGYLGRPDLTAERFVADPAGGTPGDRLFRTGERARFLADGRLELQPRLGASGAHRENPGPDQAGAGGAAPRTATERALAEIWCTVLGVDTVGVHDNFFALGGHSLTAIQLVERIRAAFRTDLPLLVLLGSPTIAGLADLLGDASDASGGSGGSGGSGDEPADRRRPADLLAGLDQLSDAEVDELLAELVAEEPT